MAEQPFLFRERLPSTTTLCAGGAALVEGPAPHSAPCVRYQQLEEASASLRERIRHLDDMVHCQQKKVKQMVEEVSPCERSRARTAACRGDPSALQLALPLSSVRCGSRVEVLRPLSSWPEGNFLACATSPTPRGLVIIPLIRSKCHN